MLLTALSSSSSSKIQPEDKRNMALLLVFPLLLCATLQGTRAATITVENKCGYPVWAAALPGGGQQLMPQAQPWTFDLVVGTKAARIWGRTGCTFDAEGRGSCQTGDCAGQLSCTVSGAVPSSLAEITLNGNDAKNTDFYDISLVDGFNVPLSIYPSSPGCPTVNCNKDINSLCPEQLKVPGGCTSACNKFQQPQYCCTGSFTDNCAPTGYSRFFKDQCPQAYSYAKDDTSSTFTCPSGGNYRISFCG